MLIPDTDEVRYARYADYLAAYQGEQWTARPREDEKRLTINYLRALVNKAASYLMGQPVRYQATRRDDTGLTPPGVPDVTRFLDQVADANHLAGLDLDAAISAAVVGDGAYTVRWDAALGLPRVTGVDPGQLRCRWRPDDLHTLTWLEQTYRARPSELPAAWLAGRTLFDVGDEPLEIQETWWPGRWAVTVGGQAAAQGANPYGRIPYVVFPNLRVPGAFWGQSDLVDLLEVQRDLNSRFSVLSQILELSGSPITVVENVTDHRNLRVGPGQVWDLPEKARAYLLDLLAGGGVGLHIDYLNLLYRALHDLAEMPRTSFGDSSQQGAKSGVALEIELQPLLHKIARKRLTWGVALQERAALILAVAETHGLRFSVPASALRLAVEWPPVLPQDRAALAALETQLVGAAIHSRQRALAALGEPDPAAEWRRILQEGEEVSTHGGLANGHAGAAARVPQGPDAAVPVDGYPAAAGAG